MKNRTKKSLLVIIICLVIIGIIWIVFNKKNTGPRIESFVVEKPDLGSPNFTVIAFKLGNIEIWGVPDSTATSSKKDISLGKMEMVESNAEGEQTWILEAPEKALPLKAIYAQGFLDTGSKANKVTLASKGGEKITTTVWPERSQAVITGTVKDVKARSLTMGVSVPVNAALTVVFGDGMTVVDASGKAVSSLGIRSGKTITVTGDYTNENTFLANKIEL